MRRTLLSMLVLAAACWDQGQEPPGDPVGSFEARGLMVEQSCGSAIPAPDPIELTFDLRAEAGGRAYWRRHGGEMFAGIHSGDQYTFQVGQSWMVIEPDRFRGYVGCSVTQRDVFTFLVEAVETDGGGDESTEGAMEPDAGVDAGVEPTLLTLSGSQTTEIVPLAGADCTPAVVAAGGPFLSLPCRVEYVLTGTGIAVE